MKRFLILATVILSFSICQSARAGTINLSTGQDASGNIQTTAGAPDANWSLSGTLPAGVSQGTPAQILVYTNSGYANVDTLSQQQIDACDISYNCNNWWPGQTGNSNPNNNTPGWAADTKLSSWIGVSATTIKNGNGPYSYTMTFNLTAAELATASITGAWAIDDAGSLYLNGNLISTLADTQWMSLTGFQVPVGSSDLVVGTNTLTMTMTYTDDFIEGADLQGSLDYGTVVPEPGSLLLLGTGMLGMAGMLKRKLLAARR